MIVSVHTRVADSFSSVAIAASPFEACGLLLGRKDSREITVEQCIFTDNVSSDDKTKNFEVDPQAYLKLQHEARKGGPSIIGVWHSHPNGSSELSQADKQRSMIKGWLWLLTAICEADVKTTAFTVSEHSSHAFSSAELNYI